MTQNDTQNTKPDTPLARWIKERGMSINAFGVSLQERGAEVTTQRIYQICQGGSNVSERLMAAIYQATNGEITPNDLVNPALFPDLQQR